MKKIMFVCQGNICRSPLAMFILRYRLKELGLEDEYQVISGGLERSTENLDMDARSKKELDAAKIPYSLHKAHMVLPRELLEMDYILYMENFNRITISRLMSNKKLDNSHRLLDYSDDKRDILDPYYTGDFHTAFKDIYKGIDAFIHQEIIKDQLA